MNRFLLLAVCSGLLATSAFAVDGQVLINQSTVMASGGFPYHITQPGSYKLTGNLAPLADQRAIIVDASYVTLDLNGFKVECGIDILVVNPFGCISEGSGISDVAIRNGSVVVSLPVNIGGSGVGSTVVSAATPFDSIVAGIRFSNTPQVTIEDVRIHSTISPGAAIFTGPNAIIRHNTFSSISQFSGGPNITCPSLLEGNVNTTGGFGSSTPLVTCVFVNNIGLQP
jgi:hypothetical protein